MKKALLILAVGLSLTGNATSTVGKLYNFEQARYDSHLCSHEKKAELLQDAVTIKNSELKSSHSTRGEETRHMDWGYCGTPSTGAQVSTGEMRGAILLPAEQATEWAGAVISSISVANGVDIMQKIPNTKSYKNPIRTATVWISESLDDEPLITTEGELGEVGLEWSTIQLDESYTLKENVPVYIGFTIEVPTSMFPTIFPLITDGLYPINDNTCFVYSTFNGHNENGALIDSDTWQWTAVGTDFGNIGIRAGISGDMLPYNQVRNLDWSVPFTVAPDTEFEISITPQNMGANAFSSLEYTLELEGATPQTYTVQLESEMQYRESQECILKYNCNLEGNNISYKLYLSAINGESIDADVDPITGMLLSLKSGYPRNYVFEEATGTWCGYCVIGYAGMEYMRNTYSGKGFIGIAMHSMDRMDVIENGAYSGIAKNMPDVYPAAYVNREFNSILNPSPGDLDEYFKSIRNLPAFADIKATLESGSEENTYNLNTTTRFALKEDNANYSIAYTVIKDNVGPYKQKNFLSGLEGDYAGFEDLPEDVDLIFNDVALNCSHPEGIAESLPNKVMSDTEYEFSTILDLSSIDNTTDCRVVAMVINNVNGRIENACEISVPQYSKVDDIFNSDNIPFAIGEKGLIRFRINTQNVEVFTIAGQEVKGKVNDDYMVVPAGVYIVRDKERSLKVVVR